MHSSNAVFRAWTSLLFLLAFLSTACRAKPGSTCSSEGEAFCDGTGQMLTCVRGVWSPIACAGTKGCSANGRFIDCDESVARAGDPCGTDGANNVSCGVDGRTMMHCDGHSWTAHRLCRGPKACAYSHRFVDCDDSVAEVGDACDSGQRSCSVDGSKLLFCAKNVMNIEEVCAPGRCQIRDKFVDCE